jgi:hypothetical protein
VYRDGALVAPSSGTVSVYDADGTAVVDEQAVTVTASIAAYSVSAATLPVTLALSDRWRVQWTLAMPDGATHTFIRDAGLVRSRLYPVVADVDLTRLHTELREWLAQDQTSLQGYRDAAWDAIVLRLLEDGRWPHLILSPWALRGAHIALTLALAFRDYAASSGGSPGKYDALAAHYAAEYDAAWGRIRLTYDLDKDGLIDDDEQGVSGEPVLMTTVPGNWRWPGLG